MSFILEALKKSENKRRKKSVKLPRSIHEPVAYRIARPRSWTLWIFVVLAANAALLFWFFGPWPSSSPMVTVQQEKPSLPLIQPDEDRIEQTPSAAMTTPQQSRQVVPQKELPDVGQAVPKELPVPRNDKHVYTFQQLPPAIKTQIPVLKMSLHAYNRSDTKASLVQINNRIYREGDDINGALSVERITEDGAVMRYDGYRYLLPRRGN